MKHPGNTDLKSARRTLAQIVKALNDQRLHFALQQYHLIANDPADICELDDTCQQIRRLATELAYAYREQVIGLYIDSKEVEGSTAELRRPVTPVSEAQSVPVAFVRRQAFKTRVQNETYVVERLLQWAGGDYFTVFSSKENGALRKDPWRTSLIEEACGRNFLVKEPDGEPKVIPISQYQEQRKDRPHGCQQISEG